MASTRDPIKLQLTSSIPGYDREPVSLLMMKAPTGLDILETGYPFSTRRDIRTGEQTQVVNVAAARLLIGRCTGLPPSSVDMMEALDWRGCMTALEIFFFYRPVKGSDGAGGQGDTAANEDIAA